MKFFLFSLIAMFLVGCKPGINVNVPYNPPAQVGPEIDGWVVRGQANISYTFTKQTQAAKYYNQYLNPIPQAFAAAVPTVTYIVAPNSTFTVNVSAFGAAPFIVNDTMNLGDITVTALNDNRLKVCGPLNNQKCTVAAIRMYTTQGFLHSTDLYTLPMTSQHGADPIAAIGVGVANAGIVQSYVIPAASNRVKLTNFPTPTFINLVDLFDAGAGTYTVNLVIEFVVGL